MELRLPTLDEDAEFRRAVAAVPADNPSFLHFHRPGMTLAEYLEVLRQMESGIDPVPGREVPSTFRFAFADGRIVGRAAIRHGLDFPCGQMAGHIGYAVLPEFRGRGHATEILRLALAHAHRCLGIDPVLVTCDPGNGASIRVIEKNGGVLADQRVDPATGGVRRRYRITAARDRSGSGRPPSPRS